MVIVAAIALAIIASFFAAAKALNYAKAKIAAVALANERMEIIRNMPYDDIGTTEGAYPPGIIPSEEEVDRKNIHFVVITDIRYRDDPFDGTIDTDPPDIYPYDYKKVEIKVYKIGSSSSLATLTTNISGSAAETSSDTGILYFCVIDEDDQPVSGAEVTIENDDLAPPLSLSFITEANGCVMIPILPPDEHNNYHIVVTKDGFSLDQTYPRTPQNPNQTQPNIDIFEQEVTRLTLRIDQSSTINISAVDLSGNPVPDLNINIRGAKEIQFNPVVYKYNQDHDMDSGGLLALTDMEFDDYYFSINTPGYYLSSVSPIQPTYLTSGSILDVVLNITESSTAPLIYTIFPPDGVFGLTEELVIEGNNFDSSAVVKLIHPTTGQEIVGTDLKVTSHNTIEISFDLSQTSLGIWDLSVENPGGEYVKQIGGFEVLAD